MDLRILLAIKPWTLKWGPWKQSTGSHQRMSHATLLTSSKGCCSAMAVLFTSRSTGSILPSGYSWPPSHTGSHTHTESTPEYCMYHVYKGHNYQRLHAQEGAQPNLCHVKVFNLTGEGVRGLRGFCSLLRVQNPKLLKESGEELIRCMGHWTSQLLWTCSLTLSLASQLSVP